MHKHANWSGSVHVLWLVVAIRYTLFRPPQRSDIQRSLPSRGKQHCPRPRTRTIPCLMNRYRRRWTPNKGMSLNDEKNNSVTTQPRKRLLQDLPCTEKQVSQVTRTISLISHHHWSHHKANHAFALRLLLGTGSGSSGSSCSGFAWDLAFALALAFALGFSTLSFFSYRLAFLRQAAVRIFLFLSDVSTCA